MTCPITGNSVFVLLAVLAAAVIGFVLGRLSAARRGDGNGDEADTASEATGEGIELYVGNLPYKTTERELAAMFGKFGKVLSVRLIKNKANGKSRGYGFVEMDGQGAADKAVSAMSGADVKGRKLVVNEAKSQSRD